MEDKPNVECSLQVTNFETELHYRFISLIASLKYLDLIIQNMSFKFGEKMNILEYRL